MRGFEQVRWSENRVHQSSLASARQVKCEENGSTLAEARLQGLTMLPMTKTLQRDSAFSFVSTLETQLSFRADFTCMLQRENPTNADMSRMKSDAIWRLARVMAPKRNGVVIVGLNGRGCRSGRCSPSTADESTVIGFRGALCDLGPFLLQLILVHPINIPSILHTRR